MLMWNGYASCIYALQLAHLTEINEVLTFVAPFNLLSSEIMARLSGMQRQILSLHRSLLRAARNKPAEVRWQMERYVNLEFRKHATIDKKDYQLIEHLIRRGEKQLTMLRSSEGFSVVEMR